MLPFELTKDTPYLALSGELWSVFYEYLNRNWSCYKGFLLYLVATCPQAISYPDMAFGLFSGRQPHECLEWIPIGNFSIDRTPTMDNSRFVARIQMDGNNFGGYYFKERTGCFGRDDDGEWIPPPLRRASLSVSPSAWWLHCILHALRNRFSCTQAPLSPSYWSALYRWSRLASLELNTPQGQQRTAGVRGGR